MKCNIPSRPSLSLARMGERLRSGNRNSFSTFDVRKDDTSSISSPVSRGCNGGRASRIPVLNRSLSSKVPKEIRFGTGAQRTFENASNASSGKKVEGSLQELSARVLG